MRSRWILLASVLTLAATSARAFDLESIEYSRDFDRFTHHYYEEPNPDLVEDAIRYASKAGVFQKKSAIPPLSGFFSEIFRQNPAQMMTWLAVIKQQDETTRRVLESASATNPRADIHDYTPSPQMNDMCWGAFFASGRLEYLNRILDNLQYLEERADIKLYLTGASAKWSLDSNAENHALVRETLRSNLSKATAARKKVLEEILTRSPADIEAETIAVLEAQRRSGVW
jgi:hypothetical protein